MSSPAELLQRLHRAGCQVEPAGIDRLKVTGPPGALTDDLRAELADHKVDVLALLQRLDTARWVVIHSALLEDDLLLLIDDSAEDEARAAAPKLVAWRLHEALDATQREVSDATLRAIHRTKKRLGGYLIPESRRPVCEPVRGGERELS